MAKRILYPVLSALLLALPWLGGPSLSLLVAFVPLLILQANLKGATGRKGRPVRMWPYAALTFALWWTSTTWWVGFASAAGAVVAVLVGTALNTAVFTIYHAVWKRAPRALAYTVLVAGWIAYEKLYTLGQISFPWLTLGNGLAGSVKLAQWYEYTGVFGGSLWILVVNLLVFHALGRPRRLRSWIAPAAAVLLPAAFSLALYYSYREPEETVSVSVVQPNFDAYKEKFRTSTAEQHRIIIDLMRQAPPGTDFIVAPETAMHDAPWEDRINTTPSVLQIRQMIRDAHPGASVIAGYDTRCYYATRAEASPTARTNNQIDYWYDIYNSALVIDSTERVGIHHKSRLVVGAETLPYPELLSGLDFLIVRLGGTSGQRGVDSVRRVFAAPAGIRHATAICYESIYGAYYSEFVRNGAQIMFVITNDGWWRNTTGYRNHFAYARLRAIENRRSVARSANTGISGFIDQRGDVGETLGWDLRGVISADLHLNDRITFYTRYGDLIGRVADYVFLLGMLYFMAYRVRKKSHLVD